MYIIPSEPSFYLHMIGASLWGLTEMSESLEDVYKANEAGDVAALIRSQMNVLQPFESTIEQTTQTMPLATKQKQLQHFESTIAQTTETMPLATKQ